MKLLFFSDIHGVYGALAKLFEQADRLRADQLIFLGDALYHGPRNGVPDKYDAAQTADLLNTRKDRILAVRGNCDSEVDQMMLDFPVMADFSEVLTDPHRFFLTHGHIWNENHLPPIPPGTILAHGHTHVPVNKTLDNGIRIFNPGSISLPKMNFPPTFGFYDGESLAIYNLADGKRLGEPF